MRELKDEVGSGSKAGGDEIQLLGLPRNGWIGTSRKAVARTAIIAK